MLSQAQGRTRFRRLLAAAGCVALVSTAAACAAKVDEQKAPPEEVTTKELSAQHGKRQWRGPVKRVIEAARVQANLTAEQAERIDTIAKELEDDADGREALHQKLRASAVNVVRAGTTDSEEFDQSVSEAVQAVEERMTRNTDALEEVHGILTPTQRSAVANVLRAQIAEKYGQVRDDKRKRKGFDRFASDLMLSKRQLDQLTAIQKEFMGEKKRLRPTREELTTLVDAFETEEFGVKLTEFRAKKIALLRSRVAEAGQRTDTVLSIFTAEQREILADLILEGPAKVFLGVENEPAAKR